MNHFSCLFPGHRKDLKSRSPNLGPYTTKGTLKELPQGIYFLGPSGGLGSNCRLIVMAPILERALGAFWGSSESRAVEVPKRVRANPKPP